MAKISELLSWIFFYNINFYVLSLALMYELEMWSLHVTPIIRRKQPISKCLCCLLVSAVSVRVSEL